MHQIAYTARLVFAFASKSPLVAQLDRAPGFEPGCREFESLRAGQFRILYRFQDPLPFSGPPVVFRIMYRVSGVIGQPLMR